jgi:hypothetical protein
VRDVAHGPLVLCIRHLKKISLPPQYSVVAISKVTVFTKKNNNKN